ncbi:membrane lipoprotein lipid attachment site-containing protein [Clostridium lacusfryxellense]|uniref:membrane lipoprotein lipid attachment site-containing protein n=1 Tax=Clostridium lacusfryxellense TaxID=205328 RepID=UPI001C0BA8EE|nr:membrane lipoprotein lipid attachment site-containing protein [Clostridium lacusfryxellense]MBU3114275.1 membrane lipoprotein lipid attachment site-containing protein [Clostridium lacusfryxellense]
MKKILLIIILTTMVAGCSSTTKDVKNTPEKATTNTQIKDQSQTTSTEGQPEAENTDQGVVKDTTSKGDSSVLKNIDESKSQFEKGYYDYEGTINKNIAIQMSIYKSDKDKELVGTYFYEKQRKEIKLKGKSGGTNIILYEYDGTGKNTAIFQGTMKTVDKIEGTWRSVDNKISYPFTLSLKSNIVADEYGKRYAVALNTKSDQDVEEFASKIKNYIVNDNKEQLAEQIKYPINSKIDGKVVKIENKDYFIENYDKIINPNYKSAISSAFTKYLFVNYKGIMFGQNEYNMWINEITPTDGKAQLMITAINN